MKNVKKYSEILSTLVREEAVKYKDDSEGFSTVPITDTKHHQYLVVIHGFRDFSRFYAIQYHFEIIDGKVWIQRDITDIAIHEELVKKGIPKEDIVLGYKAEYARYLSGYGVDNEKSIAA